MRFTKPLALAAALAAAAGPVLAGGFAPVVPVEPPTVVVEPPPAPRSTWGVVLPIVLLGGLIALAVANDSDSEDDTPAE
ncbi:hypothetical protein ruthe_03133 [Rubellimicrobium thermophilum DSM 16684]|uniref:Uncharacterized protein n=1 Tax=Rubellimicrobium thermophilum DSM 16684 TaxID=1123069 RepID=S9RXD5_9RHOB|nr:hypothetical protein [Rubellimicrobium thermophilum]EPX82675.1 hypothetical protein ruthe_03133 [Rubellimicrobium thermophilum DSM 16684]